MSQTIRTKLFKRTLAAFTYFTATRTSAAIQPNGFRWVWTMYNGTVRTVEYINRTNTLNLLVLRLLMLCNHRKIREYSFWSSPFYSLFVNRDSRARISCLLSSATSVTFTGSGMLSRRWTWTGTVTWILWWARAQTRWAFCTRGRTLRSKSPSSGLSSPRTLASHGFRCQRALSTATAFPTPRGRVKMRSDLPRVARSESMRPHRTRMAVRSTSSPLSASPISSAFSGNMFWSMHNYFG